VFSTEGESLPVKLVKQAQEVVLCLINCGLELDVGFGLCSHCRNELRTTDEVHSRLRVGQLGVNAVRVLRVCEMKLTLLVKPTSDGGAY
jgi:hypothetical protein